MTEGDAIQLDASGTTDPNLDDVLIYEWDLDGDGSFGEAGISATRGDEVGVAPTFSALGLDGPSSRTVYLRVTDSAGLEDTAQVQIDITNAPPIVVITGPRTSSAGVPLTFYAMASDPGLPDSLSDFNWYALVGGETFTDTGSSFTFVPLANEQFDVSVTVADDDGASTTATKVINRGPTVPATLDERLDTSISIQDEVDLYSFAGEAGRTVSLTAYWGYHASSLAWSGRLRLIDPDGSVLASPPHQWVISGGSYYYSSYLHDFVLPEDGTYFVEVVSTARSTGSYTLGISDPLAGYIPLSTAEPTLGSFEVQGDVQEYSFLTTAGGALGWTYQGGRSIASWWIEDPSGTVVTQGNNLSNTATFAFTPTASGEHRLVFQDEKDTRITSPSDVGPFGYTLNVLDDDGDGLSDNIENGAPNSGDGNGDGTADSLQSNVSSLPNAVDGTYVTIVSSSGTSLLDVNALENPSPHDSPTEVAFPLGFFSYSISDIAAGGSTTVTMFWQSGEDVDTFYKFGPTVENAVPHWYEFLFDGTTGVEILGDHLVLHLVDGQRGDDDLALDGVIVDPGGPAQFTNLPPVADGGGVYFVAEGGTVQLDASLSTDPDQPTATLTYQWDFDGDGLFGEAGATAIRGDEIGLNPTFSALGLDGPMTYDVRLRVTDDGGLSDEDTASVTVNNVAPTITLNGAVNVDEGMVYTLTLGAVTDPGNDTVTEYVVDWGDGVTEAFAGDGDVTRTYSDGPDTAEIRVTLKDEDETYADAGSLIVTVDNVPPVANDDSAVTEEDLALVISVLDNDFDVAGIAHPLEIVSVSTPTNGTAVVDDNGTPVNTTDDRIVYTPGPDFAGSDEFTYTIGDGDGDTATATVRLTVLNLPDLSGVVFDDLDNDGLFEPENGEEGIGGVTVRLVGSDDVGLVDRTVVTAGDGLYLFDDLRPGSYALIQVDQPADLLDGKETIGALGGTVDNSIDSNVIDNIFAHLDDPDAPGYLFAEIRPYRIEGLVWEDFNDDGEVNFGEKAIEGVTIKLTGTDDRGATVERIMATDAQGIFEFADLRPSSGDGYTLTESQPAGCEDGRESLGLVDGVPTGTAADNVFSGISLLDPDSDGINYNFGERPQPGSEVHGAQAATIGFWQNKNGQQLINSLNGGSTATQLANWLAATFPNMYGDLGGRTNGEIGVFYQSLFKRNGKTSPGGPPKLDAQVLAVALAVYVTNETLAGTVAADYGFEVTTHGLGIATFDVGDENRDAFGLGATDSTVLTVLDILLATNTMARNGLLYDADGSGDIESLERALRTIANEVFTAINEQGEI